MTAASRRPAGRKVWALCGDGEMDEPESMGAIGMAGREKLDNLVFVVNCNLQRLDGPVRGNGKIIQELESEFRGAGWNVIKVIWGRHWDALLARDTEGHLRRRMMEAVDGDYQTYKAKDGAFVREKFFNTPALRQMVADWSDEDIWNLNRGGHDPFKVYAGFHAAATHVGQPTVILAKTIKGYGMGESGEAQNITHQQKKMSVEAIRRFRDRFQLPVPDDQLEEVPYLKFEPGSKEHEYLRARRAALGGDRPKRRPKAESFPVPPLSTFKRLLEGSGDRAISTTMAFVQLLQQLVKDPVIGARVVPIVADESRTFGMEGMFRQLGIWSQVGQLYTPQDADQLMFYREDKHGQILQEGINEAGAMSSWMAAATSYSVHGTPTIPFYVYYSMFGFQRVGDLAWAAGDMRSRGFLLGATAGRTTLNGEGLQHEDGHSHLLAAAIPNCVPYDPAFGYEVAVIIQEGLRRMVTEQEDVYFYLTIMNENVRQPPMPVGAEAGILEGMYRLPGLDAGLVPGPPSPREAGLGRGGARPGAPRVQLLGSGMILHEVLHAAALLRRGLRGRGRRVELPVASRCSRARGARWSARTASTPARRRAAPGWRSASTARRARRSRRPITSGPSPSRSARGWAGATSCSAPTASADPTPASSFGGSSRSTGTTWWWPRSRRSRTTAPSPRPPSPRPWRSTASTRAGPIPGPSSPSRKATAP